MLYHGSKAGAFDLKTIVLECLTSMRRAGRIKMMMKSLLLLVVLAVCSILDCLPILKNVLIRLKTFYIT